MRYHDDLSDGDLSDPSPALKRGRLVLHVMKLETYGEHQKVYTLQVNFSGAVRRVVDPPEGLFIRQFFGGDTRMAPLHDWTRASALTPEALSLIVPFDIGNRVVPGSRFAFEAMGASYLMELPVELNVLVEESCS